MIFENGNNFKNIEIKLFKNEKRVDFLTLLASKTRDFLFSIKINGKEIRGSGIRGDDALWLPNGSVGYKIFANNKRYQSLNECLKNIEAFIDKQVKIFPKIYWAEIANFNNNDYIILKLENVEKINISKISNSDTYLPRNDREFANKFIQISTYESGIISKELYKNKIKPEDEWYKSINTISGKIVDFHRATVLPERYLFPSNGRTPQELKNIYDGLVKQYLAVRDGNNQPKWKGKIYQGFVFDNGFEFKGYTSDGKIYDSYTKLPFIPYGKVKGKKVLDLGSNQGFFSFQAAIHGASEVVGIELQKEDYYSANKINEILNFKNVSFRNTDAVKYLMNSDEKYSLIIANSVIHQIYKNLHGTECDLFMKKIADSCEYFAFESPVNHPTMTINLSEIAFKLSRYFKTVRLLNVYDAYSSGYRANFICYS